MKNYVCGLHITYLMILFTLLSSYYSNNMIEVVKLEEIQGFFFLCIPSILCTFLLAFIDMFQQFIFNVFLSLPTSPSDVEEQASTVLKNETSVTVNVEMVLV